MLAFPAVHCGMSAGPDGKPTTTYSVRDAEPEVVSVGEGVLVPGTLRPGRAPATKPRPAQHALSRHKTKGRLRGASSELGEGLESGSSVPRSAPAPLTGRTGQHPLSTGTAERQDDPTLQEVERAETDRAPAERSVTEPSGATEVRSATEADPGRSTVPSPGEREQPFGTSSKVRRSTRSPGATKDVSSKSGSAQKRVPTTRAPRRGRTELASAEGGPTWSERVKVTDISAIGTATEPPPKARRSLTGPERARRLIQELEFCGPEDEGADVRSLVRVGIEALPIIERAFPGLLWFHRELTYAKTPRGRDVGPLARALIAFGADAVPVLLRLMSDPDTNTRYYAVLVAGDLSELKEKHRDELVNALAQRLFDKKTDVRRAATSVLCRWNSPTVALVRLLEERATTASVSKSHRLAAIDAIKSLRLLHGMMALLGALEDHDDEVRDAAHQALRLLTSHDKGRTRRRWTSWLRKHGHETREEWLLAGLVQRDRGLRDIAASELAVMTGHHLDFDTNGSRAERKRAQAAYQEWLQEHPSQAPCLAERTD